MRNSWTLLLSVALLAASARAERGGGGGRWRAGGEPGEHPDGRQEPAVVSERFVESLSEKLELNEKQRSKISSIVGASRADLRKVAEEVRQLQERMRAAQQQLQTRLRDVHEKIRLELDNEQREEFDEMRRHMSGPGMRRHRRWPGPPGEGRDGGAGRGPRMRGGPGGGEDDDENMPPPEMWHPERGPQGNPGQAPPQGEGRE